MRARAVLPSRALLACAVATTAAEFASAQLPPAIDLGGMKPYQGMRIDGEVDSDHLGSCISGIGDLNGDGRADFGFGAIDASPLLSQAGRAYVLFGGPALGPSGALPSLSALNGTNGFAVSGTTAKGLLGSVVTAAGDLDGDGRQDWCVTEPGAHAAVGNEGKTYVLFGSGSIGAGGLGSVSALTGMDGLAFVGSVPEGSSGSSAAGAADFDGDGIDDLLVGAPGIGPAAHSIQLMSDSRDVVSGDLDSDGDEDLVASEGGFHLLRLCINDGSGDFSNQTAITAANEPDQIRLIDIENDGDRDLVFEANVFQAGETVGRFGVRRNAAFGFFLAQQSYAVGLAEVDLEVADLDGDGYAEVLAAHHDAAVGGTLPNRLIVFAGSSSGSFTQGPQVVVGKRPNAVRAGDLDVDGDLDVVVANEVDKTLTLLLNVDGVLVSGGTVATPMSHSGTAVTDLDADGDADVVGCVSTHAYVYENLGGASFRSPIDNSVPQPCGAVRASDLDQDSLPDLVLTRWDAPESGIAVLRNLGAATFAPYFQVPAGNWSHRATCADLDGDADVDIAVQNWLSDDVTLLENLGDASFAGMRRGGAYLVLGSPALHGSASTSFDGLDGSNGLLLRGSAAMDAAGTSVAFAGDLDADGFVDLTIGAPGADLGGTGTGVAYVVYGGRTGLAAEIELGELDGTDGYSIVGAGDTRGTGHCISGAGDVNGDGVTDLALGAPFSGAERGRAYVLYGISGGPGGSEVDLEDVASPTGFAIDGAADGDRLGWSIAGAGDGNGDGFDDVVTGAPFASVGGEVRGRAYLVLGGASAPEGAALSVSALDGANGSALLGTKLQSRAGWSVGGLGDVDGDGTPDIGVGAIWDGPPDSRAGSVYAVRGSDAFLSADLGELSLGAGGVQSLALNGGKHQAGHYRVLVGSLSGSSPGIAVGGLLVPLNFDAYTLLTLTPAAAPLVGAQGFLDAAGHATAQFAIPAATTPSLAGLTASHAFVTLDLGSGILRSASNAETALLLP